MSIKLVLSLLALSGIAGIGLGYVLRLLIALGQRGSLEIEVKQRLLAARERANRIISDAEAEAENVEEERLGPLREREEKLEKIEERVLKREEFLDESARKLAEQAEAFRVRENEVTALRKEAEKLITEEQVQLEQVSNLSEEEARKRLIAQLEKVHESALLARLQKLEAHGRKQLDERARNILLSAIHRMGNAVNSEIMTLSVTIPSEEMKGKVIGKEGRNIKAFERATGVDVIIDDAPDKITLSSFDPLRRSYCKSCT